MIDGLPENFFQEGDRLQVLDMKIPKSIEERYVYSGDAFHVMQMDEVVKSNVACRMGTCAGADQGKGTKVGTRIEQAEAVIAAYYQQVCDVVSPDYERMFVRRTCLQSVLNAREGDTVRAVQIGTRFYDADVQVVFDPAYYEYFSLIGSGSSYVGSVAKYGDRVRLLGETDRCTVLRGGKTAEISRRCASSSLVVHTAAQGAVLVQRRALDGDNFRIYCSYTTSSSNDNLVLTPKFIASGSEYKVGDTLIVSKSCILKSHENGFKYKVRQGTCEELDVLGMIQGERQVFEGETSGGFDGAITIRLSNGWYYCAPHSPQHTAIFQDGDGAQFYRSKVTSKPTSAPTWAPTPSPPTTSPTSAAPTMEPTFRPTDTPTPQPTWYPTLLPEDRRRRGNGRRRRGFNEETDCAYEEELALLDVHEQNQVDALTAQLLDNVGGNTMSEAGYSPEAYKIAAAQNNEGFRADVSTPPTPPPTVSSYIFDPSTLFAFGGHGATVLQMAIRPDHLAGDDDAQYD